MLYFNERRKNDRIPMIRPAKMYDPRARRYRPGCTHNVSVEGALVEIRGGEYLSPGDCIEVCIDWPAEARVMPRSQMMPVTVVRTGFTEDGLPLLGVRFAQDIHIPQAA